MKMIRLEDAWIAEVTRMWNRSVADEEMDYKKLSELEFRKKFVDSDDQVIKVNYILADQSECKGIASGCYKKKGEVGYITFLVVDKLCRNKGFGKELIMKLEEKMKEENPEIIRYEVSFFNPVNLEWTIPGTNDHDHPNAPGVDVSYKGYVFLKNRGYRDVAMQNVYYRKLNHFIYTNEIKEKNSRLEEKGLKITYYNKEIHLQLEELLDDLGNSAWKKTILDNVSKCGENNPILVVVEGDKVCGFTGPLYVQKSGRGYFAGIGIHSQYRTHGAGKVLFSALCQGLKEQGAIFMSLFTGEANPARNIYESAEFKIVKSCQVMRKELK